MPAAKRTAALDASGTRPDGHEPPFWQIAGASWRQLAGGFTEAGFSFEWHEWDGGETLRWADSFHAQSVEICLNLQGSGWVAAKEERLELAPQTAGFFVTNGSRLTAERSVGKHQFLSVEFHIPFLQKRLVSHGRDLHPLIQRCLEGNQPLSGVSRINPLMHRHRDLLRSLLHPPVLAAAQRLWYEVKALEFATEFFFSPGDGETLCTRAQRLAAERVARAKVILMEDLAETPTLEELGQLVGCSHFYLSRTFTRETGLTISLRLRRARLERAAELLRARKCALMLFRSYPRIPFYEQIHDTYPFYTDTGRLHSYSDDPTALSCGENFSVHRKRSLYRGTTRTSEKCIACFPRVEGRDQHGGGAFQ